MQFGQDSLTGSIRPTGPLDASDPIRELEIRARSGEMFRQRLEGDHFVVGRLPESHVFINHKTVSRRHAEIVRDPFDRWWVRDLGSRFGTWVNGRRVTEYLLTGEEHILIGEFELRLIQRPRTADDTIVAHMPAVPVSDSPGAQFSTLMEAQRQRLAADQLRELLELGHDLNIAQDPQTRLQLLCERLTHRSLRATTAMALRLQPGRVAEPPRELLAVHRGDAPGQVAYVSRTLLGKVCELRQPVLASNAPVGPVHADLSLPPQHGKMAAVACPLRDEGGVLDVLYVVLPADYGTSEWLALASLAAAQYRQAESAWRLRERAREHDLIERDLERARAIQARLLPRDIRVPGLDVAIGFQPCRWVGGDYADVIPVGEDRVLLLVGDVSGKGLPAALSTGNLHAIMHASARGDVSPCDLAEAAHTYFERHLPEDSFVTLLCLLLDVRTGQLQYVSAAHPRPLLVGGDGRVRELAGPVHPPLGTDHPPFVSGRDQLGGGEWLLLYTDGATDVRDEGDRMLGAEGYFRLTESVFAECGGRNAADVVRSFEQKLAEYQGGGLPADDRTILVARRIDQ